MNYRATKIVPAGVHIERAEAVLFTVEPRREVVVVSGEYGEFAELTPEIAEHIAALLTDAAKQARTYRDAMRQWPQQP